MKVIAYSIFSAPCEKFEFMSYLRGIYFNWRMNNLIYPGWKMYVTISRSIQNSEYNSFFLNLKANGVWVDLHEDAVLCRSMLERMYPVIMSESVGITHVICRDADAITTYKEAQAVQEWIDSGLGFHSITDNQAHSLPMMGGMIGFRTDIFRQLFPQWKSLDYMTKRWNLTQRGSDQQLLMADIYPKAKDNMIGHFFQGCSEKVKILRTSVSNQILGVDPKLWESNLTCRHIGSAGVVDMEVLRFFKRFDKTDYSEFEKEHSDICYWAR